MCVIGQCDCDGPNWSGALCDQCAPNYFGASCLPRSPATTFAFTTAPRYSRADVTTSWQYVVRLSTATTGSDTTSMSDSTTPLSVWGPWSGFGPCSRTCDPGVYQRYRTCLFQSSCVGDNVQHQICNLNQPCSGL